jgi:hypothetical protein
MRSAYEVLTGKPVGWRPVGTPRRRGGDNIKINIVTYKGYVTNN